MLQKRLMLTFQLQLFPSAMQNKGAGEYKSITHRTQTTQTELIFNFTT